MRQGVIVVVCLLACLLCWGQAPATTTISDTYYNSDGSPAAGKVRVSWPGFTTADGRALAAGSLSIALAANGSFQTALSPNAGATPVGTYYTVTIGLNGGVQTTEYWVVPASGPVTVGQIRTPNTPLPTLPILSLTRGGTNQASWVAGKCVRISNDGVRLESAPADCGTGGGGGGSMTWPAAAGLAVYSGASTWGTSLTAPAGALVGTSDTQALTHKDLTGTGNTFPTLNQDTTGTAAGLTAQYIDWASGAGGNSIANKPTLAPVATSGAYADLTGKPASVGVLQKSASYLATSADMAAFIEMNCSSCTLTLPASDPGDGWQIAIKNANASALTVYPNGLNLNGSAGSVTVYGGAATFIISQGGTYLSSSLSGTAAAKNIPASGDASATEVVYGTDTRLADSRTPTAHAASHGNGAGDAITIAEAQVTSLTTDLAGKPAKPIADCHNATTSKVIYDQVSNTLSCGTDQGGGAGMTNPMTTTGDVIYSADNSGTAARLAANATATHEFLQSLSGGIPSWAQIDYSWLANPPTLPANEAGTANNYLSAYNSTTGAWTKSRPTCSTLSDAGTACTATIANYAPLASPTFTGTVSGVTATMVGLGNVTNDTQTKASVVPNAPGTAGKIPISQGDGTSVWSDPFVQGTQAAGSTTLPNPVSIGGSDYAGTAALQTVKVTSAGAMSVTPTATPNPSNLDVAASTLATAAKQDTGNTSLGAIKTNSDTIAGAISATKMTTSAADGDVYVRSNAGSTFPVNATLQTSTGVDIGSVGLKASQTLATVTNLTQIAGVAPTYGDVNNAAAITGALNFAPVGRYNATTPTLTDTRYNLFQLDSRGAVHVVPGTNGFAVSFTAPQHVIADSGAVNATLQTATGVDIGNVGLKASQTLATVTTVTSVTQLNGANVPTADYDSGAGTVTTPMLGLAVAASGGPVAVPGDATNGLKVQVASAPVIHTIIDSGSIGNTSFASTVANGANVALGTTTDAASTATDGTAATVVSVLKEISAKEQAPASRAVTNAGTFATQSAVTAASGAFASGSIASGALAAGSIASGAAVDGAIVTLGAKTDVAATQTDATAVSVVSLLKELSAKAQSPAALPANQSTNIAQVAGGAVTATNVAITDAPLNLGAQAVTADNTAVTATRKAQLVSDTTGKLIIMPYSNPENFLSGATTDITGTAATTVIAGVASNHLYITSFCVMNSHASVDTWVNLTEETSGTILYTIFAFHGGGGACQSLQVPIRVPTAAKALQATCVTTGANVRVSASGYKAVQ